MKLLSEFAARWRREWASDDIKEGKKISKEIAKAKKQGINLKNELFDKRYDDILGQIGSKERSIYEGATTKLEKKLADLKYNSAEWRNIRKGTNNDKYYANRPGYNGKTSGDLLDMLDRETRQNRIKELSQKNKERYLNKTKNSSAIVKSSVSNSKKSGLIKVVSKNKLLVGAGALGAIGSGIALNRKSRNDKGKKRGIYRK